MCLHPFIEACVTRGGALLDCGLTGVRPRKIQSLHVQATGV